jgi:hypothetical protein
LITSIPASFSDVFRFGGDWYRDSSLPDSSLIAALGIGSDWLLTSRRAAGARGEKKKEKSYFTFLNYRKSHFFLPKLEKRT